MRFLNVNGLWVLQAPEEAEDGTSAAGPADTDGGSEEESDYGEMHESFESESNDEDADSELSEAESLIEAADSKKSDAAEEEEEDSGEEELDSGDEEEEEGKDQEEEEDDAEEEERPEPLTEEQLVEARNQFIEGLAEKFVISDEEADLLRTEPEKILPKMLAKVQTQAIEYAVNIMRDNLPKMVGSQVQQQSKAAEVEQKFFSKYPELQNKKAMKTAEKAAKLYRELNPDASLEEVMDNVAYLTYKKLGLSLDSLQEKLGGDDEAFVQSKGRKDKGSFVPANAGKRGASRTQAKSGEENMFSEMATLMEDDTFFDDD